MEYFLLNYQYIHVQLCTYNINLVYGLKKRRKEFWMNYILNFTNIKPL